MDFAFALFDAKDGRLIKEVELGSKEKGKKSVLRTYFNSESDEIILIGEFFKPGDDMLKDKSDGIFTKIICCNCYFSHLLQDHITKRDLFSIQ